jgi:hypothetical protein
MESKSLLVKKKVKVGSYERKGKENTRCPKTLKGTVLHSRKGIITQILDFKSETCNTLVNLRTFNSITMTK